MFWWLWKEEYWLPPGFTWKDIEMEEGDRYPLPQDLLYTLPLALAGSHLFGHAVVKRFGYINKFDLICPVCVHSEVLGLGKQCGLSQRQMEPWFHHRRNQHRPSNTKKPFGFCNWSTFTVSTFILYSAHYWYYITELGFYWSLLFCLDVKRKDFKEQIIHHIATVFLIGFSYYANYVHVGTQVMVVAISPPVFCGILFCVCAPLLFKFSYWFKVSPIVHNTLFVTLDFFHRLKSSSFTLLPSRDFIGTMIQYNNRLFVRSSLVLNP
uniref:Ceramide synthase 4a n=1 Tax=Oncorhynchus tshawytscha TaxID=74940 RepID=A0A8C8I381_ONCTS